MEKRKTEGRRAQKAGASPDRTAWRRTPEAQRPASSSVTRVPGGASGRERTALSRAGPCGRGRAGSGAGRSRNAAPSTRAQRVSPSGTARRQGRCGDADSPVARARGQTPPRAGAADRVRAGLATPLKRRGKSAPLYSSLPPPATPVLQ